ncbi:MAG: hypothetical protein HQK96_07675 [Nitrospirae bacterium]|nr:hypothetical protein [Nitrospirota bacterium]
MEHSLRKVNQVLNGKSYEPVRNQNYKPNDFEEREFYSADERAGYNYGRSIVKMICSIGIPEKAEEDFLKGINKVIFRELKGRDGKGLNRDNFDERG